MTTAIDLLIRAINAMLAIDGQAYRVGGPVTITRKDGYTFFAFREIAPDDSYYCPPPVVNMGVRI